MKRTLVAVGILAFVWAGLAQAQTEVKTTRSPEVQRMEGYIGDWAFEEKTWESPTAPEQIVKGTWQARWLGNQIEWRSRWTAGDKAQTAVEVEGWDPIKKAQYSSWFGSDGTRGSLTGTWSGTALMADGTWLSGEGKPGKARCSFAYGASFAAVEYRCESGEKGKTWVSRTGKAVKIVPSTTTTVGTGKVLGIHHIALKAGVAPADFERFAAEEWTPAFQDLYPGIEVHILKGERGSAPGTYVMVFEIGSLRVRDYYFPTPNQASEVTTAIEKTCGERCERVQSRFDQLAAATDYTDYFALVKK